MTDITLGGRLQAPAGVNLAKLAYMKDLYEGTVRGNRMKAGELVESMTTSDAVFNFAHLVNLSTFPKFDEAPRTWTQIATRRTLSDFRPAVLYSLESAWNNGTLGDGDPRHVSPIVPEGIEYPYATLRGEDYEGKSLVKRGFKVGLTWEALINDAVGFVRALPDEILRVALDTEEYEVYNALIAGVDATQKIAAGTSVEGGSVVVDNVLSRDALLVGIYQLGQREIGGRKATTTGGFNLIVSPGSGPGAEYLINNLILADVKKGSDPQSTFNVTGYNPLSGITVIESEYVSGAAWYLLPKPGQRRPVLELATLVGHEGPELRVENATGSYLGGASVGPFEGSFRNDTIDFRVRQVLQGLNWSPDLILWSAGTATP